MNFDIRYRGQSIRPEGFPEGMYFLAKAKDENLFFLKSWALKERISIPPSERSIEKLRDIRTFGGSVKISVNPQSISLINDNISQRVTLNGETFKYRTLYEIGNYTIALGPGLELDLILS